MPRGVSSLLHLPFGFCIFAVSENWRRVSEMKKAFWGRQAWEYYVKLGESLSLQANLGSQSKSTAPKKLCENKLALFYLKRVFFAGLKQLATYFMGIYGQQEKRAC